MAHSLMAPSQASTHSSGSTRLQSCLLTVPNELKDIIFRHLDEPSQICFALTCRPLYRDYFRETHPWYCRRDWYWRKDWLSQVEKDTPHYYCCLQCAKLHRWDVPPKEDCSGRKQWKGYLGLHPAQDWENHRFQVRGKHRTQVWENHPDGDWAKECFEFPVGEDHCLTFHAVRVIMNRHLYGPQHGMPLEAITLDTHKLCQETGTSVDMAVRPRIIDSELLLSVRYKIIHPQNDTKSLERFLMQARWRVCRHLQIGKHWTRGNCWLERHIHFLPLCVPELERIRWPLKDSANAIGNVRACGVCMTDYQVKISRHYEGQEAKGWCIEIAVWHQLGNGRNPLDEERWFNLAHDGYLGPSMHGYKRPGIVRHRWSKGDRTLLAVEGDYVDGMECLPEGLDMDEQGEVVISSD